MEIVKILGGYARGDFSDLGRLLWPSNHASKGADIRRQRRKHHSQSGVVL